MEVGKGHKVRIGVINCYCTLGAGCWNQRKGALWHAIKSQTINFSKVWNWLIVFQSQMNYCVAEIAATCEIEMKPQ